MGCIEYMTDLTRLDLSQNGLKAIPSTIGLLPLFSPPPLSVCMHGLPPRALSGIYTLYLIDGSLAY